MDPTASETPPSEPIRLTLYNRPEEFGRILSALDGLRDEAGLSQRDVFVARLCAEEVFTNIITHGYTDGTDHEIHVEIGARPDAVSFAFMDTATPFDPTGMPDTETPDDIMDAQIGGRGIALVKAYADTLDYRLDDGSNRFSFTLPRERAQHPS